MMLWSRHEPARGNAFHADGGLSVGLPLEKEKQGSPQVLERISKSIVGTRRFCYSLDKLVCRRLAYNGDHHLQGNAAASLKLAHPGADELLASCPRMDSHQVPWQHCRKKSSAASCLYGGTTHRGSHDGIKSLLPRLNTQPAERAPNCPTSQIPNFPTARLLKFPTSQLPWAPPASCRHIVSAPSLLSSAAVPFYFRLVSSFSSPASLDPTSLRLHPFASEGSLAGHPHSLHHEASAL